MDIVELVAREICMDRDKDPDEICSSTGDGENPFLMWTVYTRDAWLAVCAANNLFAESLRRYDPQKNWRLKVKDSSASDYTQQNGGSDV